MHLSNEDLLLFMLDAHRRIEVSTNACEDEEATKLYRLYRTEVLRRMNHDV